jgi:anti-anti-sigma regulatory factor
MPKSTGGCRIVAPVGALRRRAMSGLLETYFGVIEDGAREVWLDLSDVTAVEGGALDAVSRIAAFSHELDRRTLVVCPFGKVRRALRDAGIDQELDVYESRVAARNAGPRVASSPGGRAEAA